MTYQEKCIFNLLWTRVKVLNIKRVPIKQEMINNPTEKWADDMKYKKNSQKNFKQCINIQKASKLFSKKCKLKLNEITFFHLSSGW